MLSKRFGIFLIQQMEKNICAAANQQRPIHTFCIKSIATHWVF